MTKEDFIEKTKDLSLRFWTMNLTGGSYEEHFKELLGEFIESQGVPEKPWKYCETTNCIQNYCDTNGCQNSKSIRVPNDEQMKWFQKGLDNPIKDNRIVSDYTFARRFKSFLETIEPRCQAGDEELGYLKTVADELLQYQLDTCPIEEQAYHLNCDETLKFP